MSVPRGTKWVLALQTAVLLLLFGLAMSSLETLGPTFDEQGYVVRGLGYLRGENRHMRIGHPLGLNALNAVLLVSDAQVQLPIADPSWERTSFHRPGELFLWEIGNDVTHVMFLARLPTIWLGMLLAALVGRWAAEMGRSRLAGLLAMGLVGLDPNVLAHMRLTTTDLGLAVGTALAAFALWRYWKRPSWQRAVFAGVSFALLQNSKFTAGLFVPLFTLVILVALFTHRAPNSQFTTHNSQFTIRSLPWRPLLNFALLYPTTAFLALWAMYGFQIGTLPKSLPTFSQLGGLTLPLSHHLEQLLDIGGRMQKATPAFLLGQYSDSGWWYYFPVAFALKTPLISLFLLLLALGFWLKSLLHRRRAPLFDAAALLIPSLGYFAIALTTDINLGYRHLLPMLPLLFVFTAVTLASQFTIRNLQFTMLLSLACLIAIALWLHPHYLAYFNLLGGGPDNGWRRLVDSNIDWGQDLPNLADWMAERDVEQVWLSYFGEARPEYYEIAYGGLPSWPPRLMNPQARPFFPHEPAPGVYAISATNLQGVLFAEHDLFAWFREREPLDKVGYSIFLYEVVPYGEPAALALGGVQIDELSEADYSRVSTNDVTPHWFDPGQSLLWPEGERTWLALAAETAIAPMLQEVLQKGQLEAATDSYSFYRLPAPPNTGRLIGAFSGENGTILLRESDLPATTAVFPGDRVSFTTRWQKQAPPQPIKIFVHVTDSAGSIVAQWDGLGAAWEGWRSGDALWQNHEIRLPDELAPGTYAVWIGLYHPETGTRWQSDAGERLQLSMLEIRP